MSIDAKTWQVTPEMREKNRIRKEERLRKKYGLVEVPLSQEQVDEAEEIALVRCKTNNTNNDFTGALGELAVEQYLKGINEDLFQQYIDRSQLDSGDPGYDLEWNNLCVEIKCTRKLLRDVFMSVENPFDADVFIMTRAYRKAGLFSVDLLGWLSQKEYLEKESPNFFSKLGVHRNDLRRMEEWKALSGHQKNILVQ